MKTGTLKAVSKHVSLEQPHKCQPFQHNRDRNSTVPHTAGIPTHTLTLLARSC